MFHYFNRASNLLNVHSVHYSRHRNATHFLFLPGVVPCCFVLNNQFPLVPPHRVAFKEWFAVVKMRSLLHPFPGSPMWAKEKIEPKMVQEGAPLVLHCDPPSGLPPPIIFWMDNCKYGAKLQGQSLKRAIIVSYSTETT